jgi:hypothetical protein
MRILITISVLMISLVCATGAGLNPKPFATGVLNSATNAGEFRRLIDVPSTTQLSNSTNAVVNTNDSRAVNLPNAANAISGTFTGNGAGMTNLTGYAQTNQLLSANDVAVKSSDGSLTNTLSGNGARLTSLPITVYSSNFSGIAPIVIPTLSVGGSAAARDTITGDIWWWNPAITNWEQ